MPNLPYVKTFEQRRLQQIQKRVELLEKQSGKESHDTAMIKQIKEAFSEMSEDIQELHNQMDNLKNAVSVNSKIRKLL